MSGYEDTIELSLGRLDSEEIIEKIKGNYLRNDARLIAEKILRDRGVDISSINMGANIEDKKNGEDKQKSIAYVGYPKINVIIWMVTAFLFGICQPVKFSGSAADSPAVVVMRFFNGVVDFVMAGLFLGIYVLIKRKKVTTKEEDAKKYSSNIKSIVIINLLVVAAMIFKISNGYSSVVSFVDVAIVLALTFAIFKRLKSAKYILAFYALINPIVVAFTGIGTAAGIVWAFVFLSCCQSIAAEKRKFTLV
jgi:hypothetical protein